MKLYRGRGVKLHISKSHLGARGSKRYLCLYKTVSLKNASNNLWTPPSHLYYWNSLISQVSRCTCSVAWRSRLQTASAPSETDPRKASQCSASDTAWSAGSTGAWHCPTPQVLWHYWHRVAVPVTAGCLSLFLCLQGYVWMCGWDDARLLCLLFW